MTRLVVLAALAACGRVGFDPIADGMAGGGTNSTDGRPSDGSMSTSQPDASACTAAIPIQLNTPKTITTCNGGTVSCGMSGAESVYFEFVVPATGGYTFGAYDHGTMNISSSTGIMNATCTGLGTKACAGLLGVSLMQGETVYLTVTANNGCQTIDFTVTSS